MAGNYATPLIYVNVRAVFTNTVPVDAYRGAGRPEATFQLERVIDKAARELGIDPVEMRRRNFVKPDQFPYQTPVAVLYDTGNYHATMDKLVEISDRAGFEARRAGERRPRGKLRGFGVASYIEACGIAPSNLVGALGRARRALRERDGAGERDRLDQRLHRRRTATGRGTRPPSRRWWRACSASTRARSTSCTATPGAIPVRHGHLWLAQPGGRRLGDREGDREDHRQVQEDRRAPDGGVGDGRGAEGRRASRSPAPTSRSPGPT